MTYTIRISGHSDFSSDVQEAEFEAAKLLEALEDLGHEVGEATINGQEIKRLA